MNTTETMMEFLFSRRTLNLPPQGLAEVFDRLIWCMNDQGAELLQVRKKWLLGENKDKALIALTMDEVFPADNERDMVRLFSNVVSRWPDLTEACEVVIQRWKIQTGT